MRSCLYGWFNTGTYFFHKIYDIHLVSMMFIEIFFYFKTIFMVGALVSFFMGYFSDKFGRKTVCLLMSIIMSLSLTLNELFQFEFFGLETNFKYIIYVISQFCLGFTSYVLYVTSYVLLLEITSSKYNTIVSNVNL